MTKDEASACCAPSIPASAAPKGRQRRRRAQSRRDPKAGTVLLQGGDFVMGSEESVINEGDGEDPVRTVHLKPYRIAERAVTNAEFAAFVKATGHVTDAERYQWSLVFHMFVPPTADEVVSEVVAEAPWWWKVSEACWKYPEGPGSSIANRQNHPVVHVSWHDAAAYCAWRGTRLATEAEWEFAARGGLSQRRYPWGDELTPNGQHRCNIWQGRFPVHNTGDDGHVGTAPVDAYRPNGFGLYNMVGNTWEWCTDWFSATHLLDNLSDPTGPIDGDRKVLRGGSYLCHDSYCNRYRVSARTANTPESSTGNTSFRCAIDALD